MTKSEEKEKLDNITRAYLKVFKICEEMKRNSLYMSDIAIRRKAQEIQDTIKFYVPEAKDIGGID